MLWPKQETRLEERQVYFIQAEGLGLIKIGVANCSHSRLRCLAPMSPAPLTLLGAVKTDKVGSLEKELHRQFAEHRSHGEWFKAAPELVRYIEANASRPPKPRRGLYDRRAR
jgi:hypothetical protein